MKIPGDVKEILQTMESAGYEAWCVGGCVRDSLMGRTPADWDVATSALPEETEALFPHQAVPTGLRHGTVTVCTPKRRVEVTTYRVDGPYQDHRRPLSVHFTASIREDLGRRDFTVNAMAADLRGRLEDPFGGQEDLQQGILRCVGDPQQRFEEDALRIMRGLRFASVLGFSVEEDTARAIRRCRDLLKEIAPERIWTELTGLLTGCQAGPVLLGFPEVLGVFWPEVLPMVGLDQRNPHHCYDVWSHSVHALEAVPPDLLLRCAALLHDVGKPACFTLDEAGTGHFYGHGPVGCRMAEQMLRHMRCPSAFRERVVRLVEWHDRFIPPQHKSLCRALRLLGEEDLRRLIALKRADNLAQAPAYRSRQKDCDLLQAMLEDLLRQQACFSLRQMQVNGRDLMTLGLKGPRIGQMLEALLTEVVEGRVPNERAALLAWAAERAHPKEDQ